ncbi:MAG: hypothetical protein U5J82_14930 [Desulfobacterales bacterium]|nr:hypothetical protein [Desulfobacterales bacterium]
MWDCYLLTFAGAFRARSIQLWQLVLTRYGIPSRAVLSDGRRQAFRLVPKSADLRPLRLVDVRGDSLGWWGGVRLPQPQADQERIRGRWSIFS